MGGYAEYTGQEGRDHAGAPRTTFAYRSHMNTPSRRSRAGSSRKRSVNVEIAGKKGRRSSRRTRAHARTPRSRCSRSCAPRFQMMRRRRDMKPGELTDTAGNAPGLSDGGAALVVTSEEFAEDARASGARADHRVCIGWNGAARPLLRPDPRGAEPHAEITGAKIGAITTSSRPTRRSPPRRSPTATRAWLGLVARERQWRRDRAGTPRSVQERGAGAGHATVRNGRSWRADRARHALSGRGQCRSRSALSES